MSRKIRVLIVDDSAYARTNLSKRLSSDSDIEIAGWAGDGEEAVQKARELKPDVITMDIVMPKMDGLDALEAIMKDRPTPVVMVSALTREGANITIRALELGAVDFVLKPGSAVALAVGGIADDICAKVKMAAAARVRAGVRSIAERTSASVPKKPIKVSSGKGTVVVIGVSTGGPQALREVVPSFRADTEAAILIVQHMPAGFTRSLAERLDEEASLPVEEAHANSVVEPGKVLIAPGGFHMTVTQGRRVALNDDPTECGVRPAVNVTMESVVKVYGADTIGVVLTGMGSDGTRGAGLIKAAGGQVIAQDESTCVVYGMPKSVADAGYVDRVVKLNRIAAEVAVASRRQRVPV
ncbi:MAG: chemotaxis response regulator protein-glutamate methylesterase [Chloroflexi bacterium]|nr:chemotaxis response regulator protein-glutamate methylesterase [Chloroflexota bacterium]